MIRLLLIALLLFSTPLAIARPPQTSAKKSAVQGKAVTHKKPAASSRLQRLRRAIVASGSLKPMAMQLLDKRSRAAYARVTAYARRHARDDAGALANLVLGYAHMLDHDHGKAIAPLKKSLPRADELADYAAYFLGMAYNSSGDAPNAIATLRDFPRKYPESVFLRDAAVVYANALLDANNPREARAVLEKNRRPARADVELAMGKALLQAGETGKGIEVLRNLYFTIPLAPEADQAGTLLKSAPVVTGVAPPSFAQRKTRADLLLEGRRYSDAAREYRDLLADTPPEQQAAITVALGGALQRAGDDRRARSVLEGVSTPWAELNAERLYYLLKIARSDGDDERFLSTLTELRTAAPASPWLEQGLLQAGNSYLLRPDYDRALDFYRELAERFPTGRLAPYAHWKVAWLSLRQGRTGQARQFFEQQVALYPGSLHVAAALYWRARLAEEQQDRAKARQFYEKIAERFPNYYYGELARQRLQQGSFPADPPPDPLLEKLPPLSTAPPERVPQPPHDNLRLQKARLLENGGLLDFAVRELKEAAEEGGGDWATTAMTRVYRDSGRYDRALRLLKRSIPSYYAMDVQALPRSYWEVLFPRPYWDDLQRYSRANRLDPFLVASLIRQESEFNPDAISHANALGLMQILPQVGRKLARQEHLRHYRTAQLLTPRVNLRLGTRYFRQLLDQYDGNLEYALAAYNAGTDRVEAWLALGPYRDPQEFVESIPFTETRTYVQAVLRNASVYRQLYGNR